jgi:hypothetical protein
LFRISISLQWWCSKQEGEQREGEA